LKTPISQNFIIDYQHIICYLFWGAQMKVKTIIAVTILIVLAMSSFSPFASMGHLDKETSIKIQDSRAAIYVPTMSPTIQGAIDMAVSDDSIIIMAGTYYETLVIPEDKESLFITGGGIGPWVVDAQGMGSVLTVRSDGNWIRNLNFTNSSATPTCAGIYLNGNYNLIENCNASRNYHAHMCRDISQRQLQPDRELQRFTELRGDLSGQRHGQQHKRLRRGLELWFRDRPRGAGQRPYRPLEDGQYDLCRRPRRSCGLFLDG
jgi:hypothetical protein